MENVNLKTYYQNRDQDAKIDVRQEVMWRVTERENISILSLLGRKSVVLVALIILVFSLGCTYAVKFTLESANGGIMKIGVDDLGTDLHNRSLKIYEELCEKLELKEGEGVAIKVFKKNPDEIVSTHTEPIIITNIIEGSMYFDISMNEKITIEGEEYAFNNLKLIYTKLNDEADNRMDELYLEEDNGEAYAYRFFAKEDFAKDQVYRTIQYSSDHKNIYIGVSEWRDEESIDEETGEITKKALFYDESTNIDFEKVMIGDNEGMITAYDGTKGIISYINDKLISVYSEGVTLTNDQLIEIASMFLEQ